ncbi:MAG: hypothetical protein OXI79_20390 [Gammaproteobacteria bacterium]|nr:hypothetical protein [Gammaproteobacteria bacterium]
MSFDPRTATVEEFEAEARRTHAECVARIDAMTDEEKAAVEKWGMPRLLDSHRELHLNRISSISGLETSIAQCVAIHRQETHRDSDAYAAEREREAAESLSRARAERSRQAREEVERRNAEAASRAEAEREEREAERRRRDAEKRGRFREAAGQRRAAERRRHEERAAHTNRDPGEDPVLRQIRVLMRQSDPERFTRSGRPRCRLLSLLVGRRVSAAERDAAWKAHREARGG